MISLCVPVLGFTAELGGCELNMKQELTTYTNLQDLPRELRDQIYALLLCSFGPLKQTLDRPRSPLDVAVHRNHTTILLLNHRVHREAYDTMVKTNRFIVICTNTALSLIKLIKASTITVVTTNAQHISQFDGYLLEVTLLESKFSPKSSDEPRMSAMILLRDLPSFYETLNRPIADAAVTIDVKVAPLLNKPIPIYKDTLHPFISQEIQRSLLAPFSAYIRVVPDVRVHGHVSHQLAITTVKDMRKDEWSDHRGILQKIVIERLKRQEKFVNGS